MQRFKSGDVVIVAHDPDDKESWVGRIVVISAVEHDGNPYDYRVVYMPDETPACFDDGDLRPLNDEERKALDFNTLLIETEELIEAIDRFSEQYGEPSPMWVSRARVWIDLNRSKD